jgi:hypothetical protein
MRLGSYKVDPDKYEGIRQNGRIKQKPKIGNSKCMRFLALH